MELVEQSSWLQKDILWYGWITFHDFIFLLLQEFLLPTLLYIACGGFLGYNVSWSYTFKPCQIKVNLTRVFTFISIYVGPAISMLLSCFSHSEFWHLSLNLFVLSTFMPEFIRKHLLCWQKSYCCCFRYCWKGQCRAILLISRWKLYVEEKKLVYVCRCIFIYVEPL